MVALAGAAMRDKNAAPILTRCNHCTIVFFMPEIIRFARSVLRMYADDHRPPHFHVVGSDFAVMVDIRSLEIISGEARTGDIAEALA